MQQLKIWIAIKQSTNLELNEPILGLEQMLKSSHTHNNNHRLQKLTKRSQQSDRLAESQCSGPPKGLSFTGLRTQLKSNARHTLSNQQAQLKEAEIVNLIENDVKSLSRPLAWLL